MKSTVTSSFPDCVLSAHRLSQNSFIRSCKNNSFTVIIGNISKKFMTQAAKTTKLAKNTTGYDVAGDQSIIRALGSVCLNGGLISQSCRQATTVILHVLKSPSTSLAENIGVWHSFDRKTERLLCCRRSVWGCVIQFRVDFTNRHIPSAASRSFSRPARAEKHFFCR